MDFLGHSFHGGRGIRVFRLYVPVLFSWWFFLPHFTLPYSPPGRCSAPLTSSKRVLVLIHPGIRVLLTQARFSRRWFYLRSMISCLAFLFFVVSVGCPSHWLGCFLLLSSRFRTLSLDSSHAAGLRSRCRFCRHSGPRCSLFGGRDLCIARFFVARQTCTSPLPHPWTCPRRSSPLVQFLLFALLLAFSVLVLALRHD